MNPKNMGLYILQGTTLTLPYKISYHAENTETYDEYLDFINAYQARVLIIESNELTNLPVNMLKFSQLERLELRGSYWCHLTVDNIPRSVSYLSLVGVRNLNTEFFDSLTLLPNLKAIEILEGHLTLLPDWQSSSVESVIIFVENYNNFTKIRHMAPNNPELWKLIPAMRINKEECIITFEPHYDQSYLGVVIVNRHCHREKLLDLNSTKIDN